MPAAAEVERQHVAGRDEARPDLLLRRLLQVVAEARVGRAGLREQRRLPVGVDLDDAEAEEDARAARALRFGDTDRARAGTSCAPLPRCRTPRSRSRSPAAARRRDCCGRRPTAGSGASSLRAPVDRNAAIAGRGRAPPPCPSRCCRRCRGRAPRRPGRRRRGPRASPRRGQSRRRCEATRWRCRPAAPARFAPAAWTPRPGRAGATRARPGCTRARRPRR